MKIFKFLFAAFLLAAVSLPALADDDAAVAAFRAAYQHGPTDIYFFEQATLKLPKGMQFIPRKQAGTLMGNMGNTIDADLFGMIAPEDASEQWFILLCFDDNGHIKDDEAKDLKTDGLLDQIKAGIEKENLKRRAQGVPDTQVVGWAEKPAYDVKAHTLAWTLELKDVAQPGGKAPDIKENTLDESVYMLGRQGYVSFELVAPRSIFKKGKGSLQTVMKALQFNEHRQYADYDAATDTVATYGLRQIVIDNPAKQYGLGTLISLFADKFAALLIIVALGAYAAYLQFRTDKTKQNAPAA